MGLEDIIKKILDDAQKQVQNILTQARQEAEKIQKEAEEQAQKVALEIIQEKENFGKQEALRVISLARLEAKKATLSFKQRMLDKVFTDPKIFDLAKAQKTVVLPDKEKQEVLEPEIYLKQLRPAYEARVAEILFEKE